MTGIALRRGRHMVRRFTERIRGNIGATMAGCAIASRDRSGSSAMAHGSRRKGRGVAMAGIALRRGRNMRAWLAGGGDAMAAGATPGHRRGDRIVVEHRAGKGGGAAMAGIALRGGGDVIGRFRQRVYRYIAAAMASGAIARSQWPGSAAMAHGGRRKGRGVAMAGIALRRGRNMGGGLGFDAGRHAMAGIAASGHRRGGGCMIEHRAFERGGRVVTGIALRAGGNMVHRFRQGIDGDEAAAMASGTIAGRERPLGGAMTHDCRHKILRVLMASIALRRGRNMGGGLGFDAGRHAMASIAASGHRRIGGGVIECCAAEGSGAAVAGIALRRGGNMASAFTYSRDTVVARCA